MKTLTINGSSITDIASFYDEINRVFMADEDWNLGPSLDALDDMLYGGFGAAPADEPIRLIWTNIATSRDALGHEATLAFYTRKLEQPELFNSAFIRDKITALNSGTGQTYFEIILEIIAGHPRIELVQA